MVSLRFKRQIDATTRERNLSTYESTILKEGGLRYAVEKGENSGEASYQEASGAPVETRSPLGYNVGAVTIVFLNISMMVGTGVFSTPAAVLKGTGSVGLALIYWFIGFLISASALAVYLEFASYFPNRSGAEVVYLEQSYPRPRYLFPVTFAIQTVLLSFSSSNAVVLAEYLFRISNHTPSNWQIKGVAIAGYTLAFLFVVFNTKWSYRISNAIGIVKLLTLIFIAITGFVVLGGHVHRVPHPTANFHNAFHGFEGTQASAYGVTNALVKIVYSYQGYANAFNVVNEIKNPVRSVRNYGGLSLLITAILYTLANIAYFAAVPKEDLVKSKQIAASLFFENTFGSGGAVKGLNFLIALSAFGNLVAVLLGQARVIRECGRQGTLPFPKVWVSTWPFGTPLGPYTLKWGLTILILLAVPAGDAFNFVVDLNSYPSAFFFFLMAVGLYLVRNQRKRLNIPESTKGHRFRAWHIALIFTIFVNLYLLIMPWYPPAAGRDGGDVSFWYAAYVVTGIGIIVACFVYWTSWVHFIPRWRGYRIQHEKVVLDGGEVTHKLIKVPHDKLNEWNNEHDAQGRKLGHDDEFGRAGSDKETVDVEQ